MKDVVRIGLWAAFWGDTSRAARQILDDADGVDYLVSDYLAENIWVTTSGNFSDPITLSKSSGTPANATYTGSDSIPAFSETGAWTVDLVNIEDVYGNVHTYSYDVLGRQTSDTVTTLGTGVDGAVRRPAV